MRQQVVTMEQIQKSQQTVDKIKVEIAQEFRLNQDTRTFTTSKKQDYQTFKSNTEEYNDQGCKPSMANHSTKNDTDEHSSESKIKDTFEEQPINRNPVNPMKE